MHGVSVCEEEQELSQEASSRRDGEDEHYRLHFQLSPTASHSNEFSYIVHSGERVIGSPPEPTKGRN